MQTAVFARLPKAPRTSAPFVPLPMEVSKSISCRMPDDLGAAFEKAAGESGTSRNRMAQQMIEHTFDGPDLTPDEIDYARDRSNQGDPVTFAIMPRHRKMLLELSATFALSQSETIRACVARALATIPSTASAA